MKWHIGCSGFYYKHWKGVFYPDDLPQRKWFDYYCQNFNTLELNNTFYSFPRLATLKKWYDDSPAGFNFALKAHRGITHYKRFNDVQDRVNELYDVVNNGLQEKAGAILFQLPPSFDYTDDRLDKIIKALNPAFNNVVEMRHNSWWKPQIYDELAKHNIAFCGMSHPTLPQEVIANTDNLYYRLHGNKQLYASPYSTEELQKLANDVKATAAKNIYIYFNNDIGASAIYNAKELMKITATQL